MNGFLVILNSQFSILNFFDKAAGVAKVMITHAAVDRLAADHGPQVGARHEVRRRNISRVLPEGRYGVSTKLQAMVLN